VSLNIRGNAVTIILVAIAVIAVLGAVRAAVGSNALEKQLKHEIEMKEARIDSLRTGLQNLVNEERQRLQQIEALKQQLAGIESMVLEGEGSLNEIADRVQGVSSSLDIIDSHTRRSIDDGGRVLGAPGGG